MTRTPRRQRRPCSSPRSTCDGRFRRTPRQRTARATASTSRGCWSTCCWRAGPPLVRAVAVAVSVVAAPLQAGAEPRAHDVGHAIRQELPAAPRQAMHTRCSANWSWPTCCLHSGMRLRALNSGSGWCSCFADAPTPLCAILPSLQPLLVRRQTEGIGNANERGPAARRCCGRCDGTLTSAAWERLGAPPRRTAPQRSWEHN